MHPFVAEAAPKMFIGAEVSDVVPDNHKQSTIGSGAVEPGEQRHEFEQLIRLQQKIVIIRGIAHGDSQLDLPLLCANIDDEIHQPGQIRHRLRTDLSIDAYGEAGLAGTPQRIDRAVEGAAYVSHAIVKRRQTVKRHADTVQARINSFPQTLRCQVAPARLDCAVHVMRADGTNDVCPVLAKIGFAADQGDFAYPKIG